MSVTSKIRMPRSAVLADRLGHALRCRSRAARSALSATRTAGSCRPTRRSATRGHAYVCASVGLRRIRDVPDLVAVVVALDGVLAGEGRDPSCVAPTTCSRRRGLRHHASCSRLPRRRWRGRRRARPAGPAWCGGRERGRPGGRWGRLRGRSRGRGGGPAVAEEADDDGAAGALQADGERQRGKRKRAPSRAGTTAPRVECHELNSVLGITRQAVASGSIIQA